MELTKYFKADGEIHLPRRYMIVPMVVLAE
jgi:hypothetical protein